MNIRVTLADGTRTQIAADAVSGVEPQGRGSLVHLNSGETLPVAQDARTVELRIDAALAPSPPASEAPVPAPQPVPLKTTARIKRYLAGRSSFGALSAASAWPTRA